MAGVLAGVVVGYALSANHTSMPSWKGKNSTQFGLVYAFGELVGTLLQRAS